MRQRLALLRPYATHPTIWVLALVALALALVARETLVTWRGALAVVAGLALFIPQEYVTHRFLLHAPAGKHPILQRAQERLHYGHHRDTHDLALLFGPLWALLPLAALNLALYGLVLRDLPLAASVSVGNTVAYLYYEYVHYVAHSPIVPFTAWGRRMKAMHLWHHHKNEHYWFGVTNHVPDVVAGTYRDVREVPASATTHELARGP